jgi:hypothetical protein
MTILTIATFASVLAAWLNVLFFLGVLAAGLALAGKTRELARLALLDAIQLYAGWQQARIDAQHNRVKLAVVEGEARLMLRDQRRQLTRQLLAELETKQG